MVVIIYGHPYGKSYNAGIRDAVLATLEKQGRARALIDLYADGFDPAAREADLALYSKGGTADPLARKYMEILGRASEAVYIYPVWWGTEPAIIKGFHDKVLLKDFAWSYTPEGRLSPKLHIQKTSIITTSDAPTEVFEDYFKAYLPSHLFESVGMRNVVWRNFGNVVRASAEERAEFLREISRMI